MSTETLIGLMSAISSSPLAETAQRERGAWLGLCIRKGWTKAKVIEQFGDDPAFAYPDTITGQPRA